jgi:hypothetical protein
MKSEVFIMAKREYSLEIIHACLLQGDPKVCTAVEDSEKKRDDWQRLRLSESEIRQKNAEYVKLSTKPLNGPSHQYSFFQ